MQDVEYTYDSLNRLSTVSKDGTIEATYTYDTNGNRASLTYANGVTETYSYNKANWIVSLENKAGEETLSSYSYTYYASGNQASKTSDGTVTTYTYDGLGRLTRESETNGLTVAYTYDSAGNRSQMAVTGSKVYTTNYTYDANNRLLKEARTQGGKTSTTRYTYDGNGNTLSRVSTDGTTNYIYNGFNQLTVLSVNGVQSAYAYNAQGIRTAKRVNQTLTSYLLDGGDVVSEVQSGAVIGNYLRGVNLISWKYNTTTEYYLYNAHGDVVATTGTNGAVKRRYDYDAFGNEKGADTTPTDPNDPSMGSQEGNIIGNVINPFRYCGEYYDTETGSYYLRARYYAPSIGRFTQQDTHWNTANMIYGDNPQKINEREDKLGLTAYTMVPQITAVMQAGNLYVYTGNSPITYADENGAWLHIVIGAAIGAVMGGALNAFSQLATAGCIDWGEVAINAVGGAVGGSLTAAGFGVVAAAITSGATNVVTQSYQNAWDFSKVDVASVLIDAAIGAIGAKIGGNAGNTAHLDTMGKNLFKRIGYVLSGNIFTSKEALQEAGAEIMKALKYYASQAMFDDWKVIETVIVSFLPWLVDMGYDVYTVRVGS